MRRFYPFFIICTVFLLTACQVNLPFSGKKRYSVRAPASVNTPDALYFQKELSPEELSLALAICQDLRSLRHNTPFISSHEKMGKTEVFHRSCEGGSEKKFQVGALFTEHFSDAKGPLATICSKIFDSDAQLGIMELNGDGPLVTRFQFSLTSDKKHTVSVLTFVKEGEQEELVFKDQETFVFSDSRHIQKRGVVEKWIKEKACENSAQLERWEQKIIP